MKDQWVGKNMNLKMLTERVRPFFDELAFETDTERIQDGYLIQAVSKIPNVRLRIDVKIVGRPNDFVVEFSAGGKGRRFSLSMIVGYLTTMFGGGYLISREAKKQETMDPFENDFWRHADMQIGDLVGSATSKQSQNRTS